MKNIEERADYLADYVLEDVDPIDALLFRKLITESYVAGAKDEHDELTRWHDPKEELPKKHHRVLLKVRKNSYAFIEVGTLQATDDGVRFIFSDCDDCEVIGWREIHEKE